MITFVLRLTFHQHTILTFNQLTSISPESSEYHRFSKHFLGDRSYLLCSSPRNPYWAGVPREEIHSMWVNVRYKLAVPNKFNFFSNSFFMKVLCSKTSNSFSNHLCQVLHSQTHHQKWLSSMVSRFLWLKFIGKER